MITCMECGSDISGPARRPTRNITVGCGVVVVQGGEFLILRRIGGWWPGQLALVGGHPEEGESVHDCAVRETLEESGLVVRPRPVAGDGNLVFCTREWISRDPFKHHFSVYVAADVVGGQLINREPHRHRDLEFISLERAWEIASREQVPLLPLTAIRLHREAIGV